MNREYPPPVADKPSDSTRIATKYSHSILPDYLSGIRSAQAGQESTLARIAKCKGNALTFPMAAWDSFPTITGQESTLTRIATQVS